MNKRKSKSGQGAAVIKKYKYEEILSFLLPHVQERQTITNIESENELTQDETEPMQSTQATTVHEEEIANVDQRQQEQEPSVILQPNSTPLTDPKTTLQSTAQTARFNKRNRRSVPNHQPQPYASNTLMEYILKNNEIPNQDINPIDAFFNGLAATIKKFSPYYQHVAKGKIFAVVQDLEWEQLQSAEPSTSSMSGQSLSYNSTPVYSPLPIQTPPTPTPSDQTTREPTPSTSTTVLDISLPGYFSQFN